eukprot:scaffold293399_cov18-Tisochrysis_lutea.AAC.1
MDGHRASKQKVERGLRQDWKAVATQGLLVLFLSKLALVVLMEAISTCLCAPVGPLQAMSPLGFPLSVKLTLHGLLIMILYKIPKAYLSK